MVEAYGVRLSLCCGRIGCRRRVLPPSVLFWGRRVYWAAVFLVVVAQRQGRTRGLSGRILPPVPEEQLPASLIARFIQARGDPQEGLAACLRALAGEW